MKFILMLAMALFSTSAFSITFDETIKLYLNKQYEPAYHSFIELSQLGNTKAQLNVAVMHARGEYVEKDLSTAYAWALVAKHNGEEGADNILDLINKRLTEKELKLAHQEQEKLLMNMDVGVLSKKLVPSYSGNFTGYERVRVLSSAKPKYPTSAAIRGHIAVVDFVSMVGKDGSTRFHTPLSKNKKSFSDESLNAYKKTIYQPASFKNRPVNAFGITHRYSYVMADSKVAVKKAQKILDDLRNKAINGSGIDMYSYAKNVSNFKSALGSTDGFDDVEIDNNFEWLYKSAQEGVSIAKYELGISALHGDQCDDNFEQSLIWLNSVAKDGLADANMIMGYEYILGARVDKDEVRGFSLLERAANANLDHARIFLAWLLATYPDKKYIDYQKSQQLLSTIDPKVYIDLRSYYEAMAATALGLGDKKAAQKALKKLAKQNKKYGTPEDRQVSLQNALQQGLSYSEEV